MLRRRCVLTNACCRVRERDRGWLCLRRDVQECVYDMIVNCTVKHACGAEMFEGEMVLACMLCSPAGSIPFTIQELSLHWGVLTIQRASEHSLPSDKTSVPSSTAFRNRPQSRFAVCLARARACDGAEARKAPAHRRLTRASLVAHIGIGRQPRLHADDDDDASAGRHSRYSRLAQQQAGGSAGGGARAARRALAAAYEARHPRAAAPAASCSRSGGGATRRQRFGGLGTSRV